MKLQKSKINRLNLKRNNLKKFTMATIIILLLQQDRDRPKNEVRQKSFPGHNGEERTSLALACWEWM